MAANPVLAEVWRGNALENIHRGAWCVARADGSVVRSIGDIDRAIFPRSAIKAIQALAMFRSGAVERYEITDEAIAMACASHHGEPRHVEAVARALTALGLSVTQLECGAHPPTNKQARKALAETGGNPSALHNNCSGKHAGMLGVALALGVDPAGYVGRDHPVQKLVREMIETVIGTDLSEDRCGTDGCSIPTFAAPLSAFATGFARMATGEGLPEDLQQASTRIFDAVVADPFLIAGTGAFDTGAMTAFGGRLVVKIGAEGVFCGALRDKGIGFALKCDDGNMVAAEAMVAALLNEMAEPNEAEAAFLHSRMNKTGYNWRKIEVNETRAVFPD